MSGPLKPLVGERLEPWADRLGADREAYTHHVVRVLELCDALYAGTGAAGATPSEREEFLAAGVFHDLGIWTAGTLDYLPPSMELATAWLTEQGRPELVDLVTRMISEHHRIRSAGPPDDPVELLRRADLVDVSRGLVRFGVPRAVYRRVAREYPNAGFHRRLLQLTGRRIRSHPLRPAPMVKW